jgi:exodeoxyribonuclease VII small subunit
VAKKPASEKSYQQLSQELAEIIDWFESDKVDLDQAVANYEKAVKLIAELENYLKTAENKITKISAGLDK